MPKARVGLCTLGCKVAQYETEAVAEAFSAAGFLVCDVTEVCDVYVVNTCTVTAESDRKARQTVRRLHRQNPRALILVTGCYSQTSPDEVAALPGVAYVGGTDGKMRLSERALALLEAPPATPIVEVASNVNIPFEPMCITHAPRTRAYVKIEDGCECRCTYCAIPGARGTVRSKAPDAVLSEIEGLVARGTREVVLTGIETASYGAELDGFRLIDLLERIERESSVERIRLGSLTPELMRPAFISRLAALKKPVPHYHLSMQSGSDGVLARMKRRYNTEMALAALAQLRAAIPNVMFTTDMMVGFPGETDAEFEETLAFSQKARFLGMHVFAYSPRKGTEAAAYPAQIPEPVKRERSARLIALSHTLRDECLDAVIARATPLRVLLETREADGWHGHSDEFVEVVLPSDETLHGQTRLVLPLRRVDGRLLSTLVTDKK